MKRLSHLDNKARDFLKNTEPLRRALRTLSRSRLPRKLRVNILLRMSFLGLYVRGVRGVCLVTGRSRGVFRNFRVSRVVFRDLASRGALPGVRKL